MKTHIFKPLYLVAMLTISLVGYASTLTPVSGAQRIDRFRHVTAPQVATLDPSASISNTVDIATLGFSH